jgi:hypothetical protein
MFPVWALTYFGWKLDFGWFEVEDAGGFENRLKEVYKAKHSDKLPALVFR